MSSVGSATKMAAAVEMAESDASPALLALRGDGIDETKDDCTSQAVVLAVARAVKVALEGAPLVRSHKRPRPREAPELPEQTRKRATMERRVVLAHEQHSRLAQFLLRRRELHARQATLTADPDSGNVCAICLEDLTRDASSSLGEILDALPCGHVYHRGCIDRWSAYNRCCPIDRSTFE